MRPAVRHTEEFDRVAALPRRVISQADAEAWAEVLTPELLCKGAVAKLRPWQAYGLAELAEHRGAYLGYPVGLGKTLITWLAPVLLGSRRSLVIVPGAGLRDKTYADFAAYVGTWRSPNPPPVVWTKQELEPASAERALQKLDPDLIMIDEVDDFANAEASACARLDRYRLTKSREECAYMALTGTPSRNSIMGYWHILCWCFLDDAPVPLNQGETKMWAASIDNTHRARRPAPGPLGPTVARARAWYRQRLHETPGVVLIDGDSCSAPITVRTRLAREDASLDRYFEMFALQKYEDPDVPDGLIVSDPLSRWRIDGQLGCGYFLRYVAPGPPQRWRDARRTLARFVRSKIDDSRSTARPLDTEAQVVKRFIEHPVVVEWLAVKATYKPHTEPVWLGSSTLQDAIAWLSESDEPSIVWSGGVEFGRELARRTRLPYFGREGKDQNGRGLHAITAANSPRMIVSWHANKRGFNLQPWRRMLIVHPPQSAKWLEQIFGRAHRSGQTDRVVVDILLTSGGTADAFETAISEAGFARATVGLTQKILRADIERAPRPRITPSNKFRWAQRGQ